LGLGMLILFQRAFAGLGMMLLRKPLINAKIKQEFNLFIYMDLKFAHINIQFA